MSQEATPFPETPPAAKTAGATRQINCSMSEARYYWSNGPER